MTFPEQQPVSNGFFFKTIRSDDKSFWKDFVHNLIDGEPMEFRKGERGEFTYRLARDSEKYEIIPTNKKDPSRKPLCTEDEKKQTTRAQSLSYANPAVNYMPRAFTLSNRLVGIALPTNGTIIQRIYLNDAFTSARLYDFSTREEAEKEVQEDMAGDIPWLHTSIESLERAGLKKQEANNEIMARIKWIEKNDDYKIVIFVDSVDARIIAQARAWDIHLAVVERRKRLGLTYNESYLPKIMFYPSLKEYTANEQKNDLDSDQISSKYQSLARSIKTLAGYEESSFDERVKCLSQHAKDHSRYFNKAVIGGKDNLQKFFQSYLGAPDSRPYQDIFKEVINSLSIDEVRDLINESSDCSRILNTAAYQRHVETTAASGRKVVFTKLCQ